MPKKSTHSSSDDKSSVSLYTLKLNAEQMEKLKAYCDYHLWEFFSVQHTLFAFKNKAKKVNVVGYKSGKLVISGKGTTEFVRDYIEAEITGDPRLGYDEVHHPEWFEAHAGLDEAGKGDFFGPLVTACVIADGDIARKWMEKGVKDSKRTTDTTILRLEEIIRKTPGVAVETTFCSMARYNELMSKPRANTNRLLAWLHAKSLEKALTKKRVPWGMLDQFTEQPLVQEYFKDSTFDLRMQTKAEADPIVAAASIVARAEFLRQMDKLSEAAGFDLMKGASAAVKDQGKRIVEEKGPDALGQFAKLHFRTAFEVLGLPVPPKYEYKRKTPK